ncbi:chorismate synthase [bacterium]|nr:chorismate synthase [bacterium]
MFRYLTAGESHGPALTAILEGMPAGVPIVAATLDAELARRQRGYGRGGRMAIEQDRVELLSGVRHGESLGSPIGLKIRNRDWPNWSEEMCADSMPDGWRSGRAVRTPRPGHADLSGATKYAHEDMRNVLERASARETAARVAIGSLARCLLGAAGIEVRSLVVRIGSAVYEGPQEWSPELLRAAEASDVRCPDERSAESMRATIDAAREAGDTVGGVFEVRAFGVPPGVGSHVASDRRLDGRLAGALMSIPAIKGVEVGMGFAAASGLGSEVHDEIALAEDTAAAWPFRRPTNRAGGLEGGISNGEPIVVRAAMKPIPTLTRPLQSVCLDGMAPVQAHAERSDVCAVPAAAVVGEAVVCFELARAFLEKFGGDHLRDVIAARDSYLRDRRSLWHWDE